MNYLAKLSDHRWIKKRHEIVTRDNFTCTCCGLRQRDGVQLYVHHGYYTKDKHPWEYESESLFTVCEDCHLFAEKNRCEIKKLSGMLSLEAQSQLVMMLKMLVSSSDALDLVTRARKMVKKSL